MAMALGVVQVAMEMQKAVLRSPSTFSGKELRGLAVSGLATPLCSAFHSHATLKKKEERKERKGKKKQKEKEEEKRRRKRTHTGMPGPVDSTSTT